MFFLYFHLNFKEISIHYIAVWVVKNGKQQKITFVYGFEKTGKEKVWKKESPKFLFKKWSASISNAKSNIFFFADTNNAIQHLYVTEICGLMKEMKLGFQNCWIMMMEIQILTFGGVMSSEWNTQHSYKLCS